MMINNVIKQAKTAEGELRFDLVTSRHGKKYFAKPVKVDKDYSWMEVAAKYIIKVFSESPFDF